MATKKSTAVEADNIVDTPLTDSPVSEPDAPQTESDTVTPEDKDYFVDLDLKFTDKETGVTKFVTNLKYSMPIEKISASGSKRTEYKIFIDDIFFGRTAKYWSPKMFLKCKSQKEFEFSDGAELKSFLIKRASEFGADRANLDETSYKDLIQTYGLEVGEEITKTETKASSKQEQVLYA